jgi:hypothetical protein
MTVGLSLRYEDLLAQTAEEVDVMLGKRRERDAKLLRQARQEIRKAEVRLAAAAEFRAAGRQLADVEALAEVPSWHPEHADHPENL